MKLLFDHNLSHRLVDHLSDLFPNSSHVRLVALEQTDDRLIWDYAIKHGYVIVTQDADFIDWNRSLARRLKLLFGFDVETHPWQKQSNESGLALTPSECWTPNQKWRLLKCDSKSWFICCS